MKPSDLDTGAVRVRRAYKDLMAAWDEASESWNDELSRAVAEQHLEPMGPVVKAALDAVGRMRNLLHEAQRELGDDAAGPLPRRQ